MKIELYESELRCCLAAVMFQRLEIMQEGLKDSPQYNGWEQLEQKLKSYLDKS